MHTDNDNAEREIRNWVDNMQEFLTHIETKLDNKERLSYTTMNMTSAFAQLVGAIAIYNYTYPLGGKQK